MRTLSTRSAAIPRLLRPPASRRSTSVSRAVSPGGAVFQPVPAGEPVALGAAEQVLPSGLPDRVWLFASAPDSTTSSARLVDLAGNHLDAVDIPLPYASAGTATGVPFTVGGRTYHATGSGVRPLGNGELLAATADAVVVLACDDQARCAPERIAVESGRKVRMEPTPGSSAFGH